MSAPIRYTPNMSKTIRDGNKSNTLLRFSAHMRNRFFCIVFASRDLGGKGAAAPFPRSAVNKSQEM